MIVKTAVVLLLVAPLTVANNGSIGYKNLTVRIGYIMDTETQSPHRIDIIKETISEVQASGMLPGLNFRYVEQFICFFKTNQAAMKFELLQHPLQQFL
jgi:hypothetical protein